MAKEKNVPAAVVPVQAYIEGVAKSLVDRIYGPEGLPWGTKLSELEDVVIAVREALSEKMLAQALQRQAQSAQQRPEPFQKCSRCEGPVETKPLQEVEPRNVETRAGEAEWDEPHCYCRKCRRSFFPSEPKLGH
jgi:Mut7-C RNAse domain